MSNTLNTLGGVSLTVIAQEALPFLQAQAAPLSLWSTNFSKEVSEKGAAVATSITTPMTASTYDGTTGYASSAGTTTAVTCTLNNHVFRTVAFTPVEVGNAGVDVLSARFVQPAIKSVVNEIYNQAYALITSANYPVGLPISASIFNSNSILSGSRILDISGSNAPRCAILNTNYFNPVVSELKTAYTFGDASLLKSGVVGTIFGIDVAKDSRLVQTAGGNTLAGFVAGRDALAIATRLPSYGMIGQMGGEEEVITDPISGLSVLLQRYYVPHLGQLHYTATAIFGVVKGNGSSLVRFVDP